MGENYTLKTIFIHDISFRSSDTKIGEYNLPSNDITQNDQFVII